jgi:hypothetical protein
MLPPVLCSRVSLAGPLRYTDVSRKGIQCLKGMDLVRAQLLRQVSASTGLGVALVRVVCHQSGDAENYQWAHCRGEHQWRGEGAAVEGAGGRGEGAAVEGGAVEGAAPALLQPACGCKISDALRMSQLP